MFENYISKAIEKNQTHLKTTIRPSSIKTFITYNKGVTLITHNMHVRNVKKIENSSIDLLRGRNSRSKSCKFHCFINFADEKRLPKHRQIASTGILDAKIFSGRPP